MLEIKSTKKFGEKITVELVDDKTGKRVVFVFPAHLYTEKFLKEKIKMLDATGIASVEGISPAKDLVGKKYNPATGVFE